MDSNKFYFAIDRGGTFTDVYAQCPNGKIRVLKLLSEDPKNYEDAPTEGIRRIIQEETGVVSPRSEPVRIDQIGWIRMGTTVATNALLERKGERMVLAVTEGFKSVLHIGNQARPNIFDLKVICPDVLYEDVIEVKERIIPRQNMPLDEIEEKGWRCVKGSTEEDLIVTRELDQEDIRHKLKQINSKGITSIAIVLLHSYTYDSHEQVVAKIAHEIGFTQISLSSAVIPMVKIVPRGFTCCSDAYLTPHIKTYLKGFVKGFEKKLEGVSVLFMQSDGGLTQMNRFNGSRAILSGPAGGVVGYAKTTYEAMKGKAVIGFDMGGTSTDVSRYAGDYEHVFESTTAGITIQAPQLDVNTVAAGGGSRLFFRSGMFVVGPESAGAHPGPVCYKKDGFLAVTDANLLLGRLLPQYFPAIFGPNENESLDKKATLEAFTKLASEVNDWNKALDKTMSLEEIAMGFIRVANESMCRPIRALTQAKGHDTSNHVLSVFGGAGGQHACAIARSLGMHQVYVHKYAGILSAFGMALADVVHELQEPCCKVYRQDEFPYLEKRLIHLTEHCTKELISQGFSEDQIQCESFLHLRYKGTDCALMCTPVFLMESPNLGVGGFGDFKSSFLNKYKCEFGFVIDDRDIIVDDIRIRGVAKSPIGVSQPITGAKSPPIPETETEVYFEAGYQKTNVYLLTNLHFGHHIHGPAIIMDKLSTILVEPDCEADITNTGDIIINIGSGGRKQISSDLDTIHLSIFSHRFMSIAEQMGRILQRTSISTNIKERLDFSCALFGPDGGLVSNAPHIPVHLGAMQETVQYQLQTLGDNIHDGDVILSNHPTAGGSHLPDLTVITPVFRKGIPRPVFYVASRGHHADIGGITPGSMPPHSTSIHQEGAVFYSFKILEKGVFQEKQLIEHLMYPSKFPGSSGTRNLQDNLSDLSAQVAANHKGIQLVNELIDQYSMEVVQAYMGYIQNTASLAVHQLLKEVGTRAVKETGKSLLISQDNLDDGSDIILSVSIDIEKGTAVFDFSGTSPEMWGNCNAPRAITVSAIIYCLRCMVGHDIPLNQGCLKPITMIIPEGSMLNPSAEAAVVGGNVQTSQRIVDVIFKAFESCAASQGCMNNVTFGDETVGYYETVGGGAGAGPSWHGRSGVHTHMTNTRITDPEILESRYPVVLNKFTLNPGTGGEGRYRGGDGLIRELMFRRPLTVSILTERRVFAPYGLKGGEDGKKGFNLLIRANGKKIRLPPKTSISVNEWDCIRLETPGGGGFGEVEENDSSNDQHTRKPLRYVQRGSVYNYKCNQESG